jgi:hypothetical protein
LAEWSVVEISSGDSADAEHDEGGSAEGDHHHFPAIQVERERGYTCKPQCEEASEDRDEYAPDGADAAVLLAPNDRP